VIPYELEGDDPHVGGHSNHAFAIATNSPDDASYMGAMAILRAVVNRIIVFIKIPTANIVNVAVSIIINSVSLDLIGIAPYIRSQIWVGMINSRIDHTDINGARSRVA
jgi:hypothetical protein